MQIEIHIPRPLIALLTVAAVSGWAVALWPSTPATLSASVIAQVPAQEDTVEADAVVHGDATTVPVKTSRVADASSDDVEFRQPTEAELRRMFRGVRKTHERLQGLDL